jgi:hypothetical protein
LTAKDCHALGSHEYPRWIKGVARRSAFSHNMDLAKSICLGYGNGIAAFAIFSGGC